MATRPKAVIESRNGEKFSPITVAKNVLTDDGQNLQDILSDKKEDMMTPTIENSSSMFKVGQGDNVDFSDNVMNGAYEDVVLKGKSLVNYIQEPSSQDVVLPYAFEDGQYVTINDTKESGALGVKLKGQTLVNIFQFTSKDDFVSSNALIIEGTAMKFNANGSYQNFWLKNNGLVKANTNYLFILDILENTLVYKDGTKDTDTVLYLTSAVSGSNDSNFFQHGAVIVVSDLKGSTKRFIKKMTSNPTSTGTEILLTRGFLSPNAVSGTLKIKLMIIEYQEGMENWDIPYFEGMQSVKMPILKSVNQMFGYSLATTPLGSTNTSFSNDGRNLKVSFETSRNCNQNNVGTLPAGTYEVSYEIRGHVEGESVLSSRAGFVFPYSSQLWWGTGNSVTTHFNNMSTGEYIKVTKTITISEPATITIVYHAWGDNAIGWCEFRNIRIIPQGKTSILTTPEEVVLRGIGDVKDTLNLTTGEYVQRIGSITANELEASDYYKSDLELENTIQFGMLTRGREKLRAKTNAKSVCNIIPVMFGNDDVFHARVDGGTPYGSFTIWMDKTKLETEDVFGLIKWLRDNNAVIQYELATPIVTKINLSSTLKSWNTTTHIYSEIPENTLYPILSHSNPTYPVILKPSTKYSIVANSYSNGHTNSAINFNLGGATASTTVGSRVTTITTPSALSNELLTMSGRGNKLNNVMVIEEDVAGDEPYFEGMCDSKSPILTNIGKNLVNVDNYVNHPNANLPIIKDGEHSYIIENKKVGNWQNRVVDKVKLKANTTYTLSYDYELLSASVPMNYGVVINLRDDSDTSINISGDASAGKPRTFTPTRDTLARLCMYATDTSGGMNRIKFSNIQLEESSNRTAYEPYQSNTTTFNQKDGKTIVLRSLPNGVCDTLNVETGEYVQRIVEIEFDGSDDEGWRQASGSTDGLYMRYTSSGLTANKKQKTTRMLCDKLIGADWKYWEVNGNVPLYECVFGHVDLLNVQACVLVSKYATVNDWITYLKQNPITVQYELATPIVKQVNVEGYPYAYENGHILLESGSQEQSLTPTIEYSIVANRSGQIRSNQRMVERHQKQLDRLQAMILTNLVNTQYEQTLTNLKYDLKNVREEVK